MSHEQGQRSPNGSHDDADQDQQRPLEGAGHGAENQKDHQYGDGNDERHAFVGALLAFVFASPFGMI